MATKIQIRRDTASNWTSNNPTLSAGEFGFETNTGKFKIGTGSASWTSLSYSSVLPSDLAELSQDALNDAIIAGEGLDKTYNDSSNTITIDIDSTVATKTYADTAVSTHSSDTTSVHGITDTAELATKAFAAELLTNATKTNIAITGDKNGLTITAENGVADSNTDNLTEGSTNKYFTDERAQDAVGNSLGTGLQYNDTTGAISITSSVITDSGTQTLTNKTLTLPKVNEDVAVTATSTEINILDGVTASTAEINILDGVTASTAEINILDGVTATHSEINILDGATLSTTELNYLDGVTSSVQSQLDSKFNTANASTTNISEGTNKYFTDERAQDAVGTALANGTHTGITVTYSDETNAISLAAGAAIVPTGSTDTASPQPGQLFFDIDTNSLKIYYGGLWLILATVAPISGGNPSTETFEYSYSGGSPTDEISTVIDGGTP